MSIVYDLAMIHKDNRNPFLVKKSEKFYFDDVVNSNEVDLNVAEQGDVVAIIGDFDQITINTLLRLIDLGTIIVPLTCATELQHDYFFESAGVDLVIEGTAIKRIRKTRKHHPLLQKLRKDRHAGLILFSSGTTGRPKAILHDFEKLLDRYHTPRSAFRTLSFLIFDHIGGINTLFHTIFNRGQVVIPAERNPESVISEIDRYGVELLPTTPTFLRLLLLSGLLERYKLESLKVVSYGTERIEQATLDQLCSLMPHTDFRQTYGLSEIGILRVKSKSRNSLWMKVGGEGVSTKVENSILHIKSESRMLGYLNMPTPFCKGWYNTGDIVEKEGEYIRIVGRASEVINVAGIKVLPSEIERVGLLHPQIIHCKAMGVNNPIIGQHIEVVCEPRHELDLTRKQLKKHFSKYLPKEIRPHRILLKPVNIGHRFKRL